MRTAELIGLAIFVAPPFVAVLMHCLFHREPTGSECARRRAQAQRAQNRLQRR